VTPKRPRISSKIWTVEPNRARDATMREPAFVSASSDV